MGLGDKRSLTEIILAKMETEHNGSTHSISFVGNKHYEDNMMFADKSFKASKQQASVETQ